MNHIYHTIQGWFSYEWLYSKLVQDADFSSTYKFVEIGSWKGKSTSYLAVEIINSGKKITLDAVDTWTGSEEHLDPTNSVYEPLLQLPDGLYNHFLENLKPALHVVSPIRMTSIEASKLYKDESIDFIMIDAAHDYTNVLLDIEHWYPKVAKGGIIAGDDFDWPGVNQAVECYFGTDDIKATNIGNCKK